MIDCWLQWMMGPWGIFDWVARELGQHFMLGGELSDIFVSARGHTSSSGKNGRRRFGKERGMRGNGRYSGARAREERFVYTPACLG